MNNNNHFWTRERMTMLATCWQAGETAATIATMLGCTRNAAISKLNHMGLIGIDRGRGARQAKKKWQEPAYRERELARLRSYAEKARKRAGHVKRCAAIARRLAGMKRIIDPVPSL